MRVIVFMRLFIYPKAERSYQGTMIELFEKTLLNGGSLEVARETLRQQATNEHVIRNNEIEHDYRVCTLIHECLMTEPKGSAGLSVAKGIMTRLREQYRDREGEKLRRKLMQEVRKENKPHDGKTREQTEEPSGEETVISGSD